MSDLHFIPPLLPGTHINDRYIVGEELDQGGMGIVYAARDPVLARDVALKTLPPVALSKAEFGASVDRYLEEARTLAGLNHPGCNLVFDFGVDGETLFLVVQLIDGESLADHIGGGKIPPSRSVELVRDLALAVGHAHSRGVVHRDLKPDNIMLWSDPPGREQPVIVDFGIAIRTHGDGWSGTTCTVPYAAPEQVAGRKQDVCAATDVYALGAILYELLVGELHKESKDGLRRIPCSHLGIAPGIEDIVHRCLAKDPGARFENGNDLAQALSEA